MIAQRFRMPAEWDRHERTVMSWPANRSIWGNSFERAKDEYAATARAIAGFEPLLMVVNPGDEADAAARCGPSVDIVSMPIDDSWMRDSGPIVVRDAGGNRQGLHFRFNAYGERFPHARDARVGARVLAHLKIGMHKSEMILEGGSIAVDGEGTLITTEQCLLNPNRNPDMTRAAIERELTAQLGAEKVIWLPWGRVEDLHTDGHVDVVCMFVRPGVVIAQGCEDRSNPNYERMQANLRILRTTADARGRQLQIIELPMLPLVEVNTTPTLVSNANAYFVNRGLIVPVAGTPEDDRVLEIFRRACPEREVVGVGAAAIGFGGGGIHCITQQIPMGA